MMSFIGHLRYYTLTCVCLSIWVLAGAQQQNKPNLYLPNNAVLYTYQDNQGYMWFGTYDGLSFYNGTEIITYRHEPSNPLSLCSNIIYKITQADAHHIWISTTMGLNKLSLVTRKITASYPAFPKMVNIESDATGDTWMMNSDHLLLHYKLKEQGTPQVVDSIELTNSNMGILNINRLFVVDSSLLILKNDGHLLSKNIADIRGKNKMNGHEVKIHDHRIVKACLSGKNLYFIDKQFGVYHYDLLTSRKHHLDNIKSMIHDDYGFIAQIEYYDNAVYVALKNSGILKVRNGNDDRSKWITPGVSVFCLLADRYQNLLWIGTDGQGVQQHSTSVPLFGQVNLSIPKITNKPVRALLTDSLGNLWVGTNGDGLMQFNYTSLGHSVTVVDHPIARFNNRQGLNSSQIFGMAQSKYHDLFWIGTEKGLYYYSYRDRKIHEAVAPGSNLLQSIHTILEADDGKLWLTSTRFGLVEVDIEERSGNIQVNSIKHHLLSGPDFNGSEIQSMVFRNPSTLVVGLRGGKGAALFDINTYKYTFLPIIDPKNNQAITDVLTVWRDANHSYYLGSSAGITKFNLTNQGVSAIKNYNKKDGLINDMIHGILGDDIGYLWLSSSKGLIKYNPQNEMFHNYNSPTLDINEFSDDAFYKCPYTGTLYFGAVNGFMWVNRQQLLQKENFRPNQFNFFDVKIKGESHPLTSFASREGIGIEIPDSISTFSISFALLEYLNKDYTYSYKIENYNDEWIALTNTNQIDFTNLPAGKYELKVRYKNDVTPNSEHIDSLIIVKLYPWYLSRVAVVFYILLLTSLVYYLYQLSKRSALKKREEALKEMEKNKRKEILESKLAFFTQMTHEFYTPLTLIKGISEILKENSVKSEAEYQEHLNTLTTNAVALEGLMRELLDIHDPEKVVPTYHIQKDVQLTPLSTQYLKSFRLIASKSQINYIESIEPALIWNTDTALFQRILNNLVSNAFKYVNQNGTVKINLYRQGNTLELLVYNSGQGIEASELTNIFQPYHILDNNDENAYRQLTERTGLGLSICRAMIELLEGHITVESEVNQYTLFRVSFPFIAVEDLADSPAADADNTLRITRLEHEVPSILLVDDNKDIISMVSKYLSPEFNILTAESAQQALDILASQSVSLILTDIMMPGKDGIELIEEIRNTKSYQHIPVIVLSAKSTVTQQETGIQAGADIYLTKPFSLSLLRSHIDHLVKKNEVMRNYFYSPESAYENIIKNIVHRDDKKLISALIAIIDEHIENPLLSPTYIADIMNTSPRSLYRKVKKITSLSLMDFIKDYKLLTAERLLVSTNLSVQEIMYKSGMSNKSYFYREFVKRNKVTPKQFRKLD